MSMDKSLIPRSLLKRHKNVLSRFERITRLKEEEKWEEGRSVFALPKVRNIMASKKKAGKPEEEDKSEEASSTS